MSQEKKKIRLKISEAQKARLEYLLEKYQYIIRGIELDVIDYDPKTNLINYVLTVGSSSYYYIIIETLALNGFAIESNDPKVNKIIEQVADKYKNDLIKYAQNVSVVKKVDKTHDSLDKLIETGNYKALIRISRDITYNTETVALAKSTITLSVTNAIVRSIENVAKRKSEAPKTIESLIAIASDPQLKLNNCDQLMEQAGIVAIELSAKDQDSMLFLIKISNQKNLDYLLNIKAALKFGEIVMEKQADYTYEIVKAAKEMNTRWLEMIYPSISYRLEEEEKEFYHKVIDFVVQRRNKLSSF